MMNINTQLIVTMDIPLLLQLVGLTFAVLTDPYILKRHRRIMLVIIALDFSLLVQNNLGYLLDSVGTMPYERTLVGIFGYAVRPAIIVLFFYVVSPRRKYGVAWILLAVNAAVHLTATFSGICFSIDADNNFHRGPLGYCCHITSAIMLAYLVYLTLHEYGSIKGTTLWVPLFNAGIIIASVVLDSEVDYRNLPVVYLTMAVISSNIFYYIWLHLQFVREHEEDLRARQRIQIMMTQIQPHFLFNTIATFQALCRKNPAEAAALAGKFANYLRQNLDTLAVTGCIPFRKELAHTELYADIEMVRFDNIRVDYAIMDDEFAIPPLTIQPIVENAIRHGVRIRDEGIVSITTRRRSDAHEIVIQDNGIGFDAAAIETADGSHIGIANVRERIETMCGGALHIESIVGTGTTVTIRLPMEWGGNADEHDLRGR